RRRHPIHGAPPRVGLRHRVAGADRRGPRSAKIEQRLELDPVIRTATHGAFLPATNRRSLLRNRSASFSRSGWSSGYSGIERFHQFPNLSFGFGPAAVTNVSCGYVFVMASSTLGRTEPGPSRTNTAPF